VREGRSGRLHVWRADPRIADDGTNDWVTAKNGALVPNKEIVLRSKLRIEARQFHMSRLHAQTWGDKQTIDIKNDWALLSEEERRRKGDELIAMIQELREPPMQPPGAQLLLSKSV
jgi:hypothetical protein